LALGVAGGWTFESELQAAEAEAKQAGNDERRSADVRGT